MSFQDWDTVSWDKRGQRDKNLTKDQKFTTLFYKATVQLSQHNFTEALITGNN